MARPTQPKWINLAIGLVVLTMIFFPSGGGALMFGSLLPLAYLIYLKVKYVVLLKLFRETVCLDQATGKQVPIEVTQNGPVQNECMNCYQSRPHRCVPHRHMPTGM